MYEEVDSNRSRNPRAHTETTARSRDRGLKMVCGVCSQSPPPATYFSHLLYLPKQCHRGPSMPVTEPVVNVSVKLQAHQLVQKGSGFLFILVRALGWVTIFFICSGQVHTTEFLALGFLSPQALGPRHLHCLFWQWRLLSPRGVRSAAEGREKGCSCGPPFLFLLMLRLVLTVWAVVGSNHPGTWPSGLKEVPSVQIGVISAVGSSTA